MKILIVLGSVNVKQSELKAFMRIAENLQIKGLAANSKRLKIDAENIGDEKTAEAKCKFFIASLIIYQTNEK